MESVERPASEFPAHWLELRWSSSTAIPLIIALPLCWTPSRMSRCLGHEDRQSHSHGAQHRSSAPSGCTRPCKDAQRMPTDSCKASRCLGERCHEECASLGSFVGRIDAKCMAQLPRKRWGEGCERVVVRCTSCVDHSNNRVEIDI